MPRAGLLWGKPGKEVFAFIESAVTDQNNDRNLSKGKKSNWERKASGPIRTKCKCTLLTF